MTLPNSTVSFPTRSIRTHWTLCFALAYCLAGFGASLGAQPALDADYPGGNIVVTKVEGDTYFLQPDLRGMRPNLWWFYWNFRVREAAGKTLTFRFTERNPFDFVGPAISRDRGMTWSRMGAALVRAIPDPKAWEFSHTFSSSENEVRFCFTIPHLESDFRRFLARYRDHAHLAIDELCRTRKGRSVERLRLGKLTGEPRYRVLLTARHHACESLAGYELEGIIEAVLAKTDEGRWWRENVEIWAVPFMDKDGVEDGDQGKQRAPRDHNRDYEGQSVHLEVAALREQVPAWLREKPLFALDLHCPYLRDNRIYLVGGPNEEIWRNVKRFSAILESTQQGPIRYQAKHDMPFGTGWNSLATMQHDPGKPFSRWAAELPGARFAATLEFPYSQQTVDVSAESSRIFGHDIARAIRLFLQGDERRVHLGRINAVRLHRSLVSFTSEVHVLLQRSG